MLLDGKYCWTLCNMSLPLSMPVGNCLLAFTLGLFALFIYNLKLVAVIIGCSSVHNLLSFHHHSIPPPPLLSVITGYPSVHHPLTFHRHSTPPPPLLSCCHQPHRCCQYFCLLLSSPCSLMSFHYFIPLHHSSPPLPIH